MMTLASGNLGKITTILIPMYIKIINEFEKNFKSGFNKKKLRDILSKNKNFIEIALNDFKA